MDPTVGEWLHLALRFMHLIAGIMWIGNSLFFNWLDRHLVRSEHGREGVEGELWMVHSGGFYQVEKKLVAPDRLPKILHWFKWEAGFTWISGFLLLILVYYTGGGVYLVDPGVSAITSGQATALGVGLLGVGWVIYDQMVRSSLARSGAAFGMVALVLTGGVAYGLFHLLSGRAAYLHVGALFGTLMAANVWLVIIPAQQHLVDATREGRRPNPAYAHQAKQRSIHNNYMTFPLLFIMLSNHFPGTYGHPQGWLILCGLIVAGAAIRHYMNTGDRSPVLLILALATAATLAVFVHVIQRVERAAGALDRPAGSPVAPERVPMDPEQGAAPIRDAAVGGPLSLPATMDPGSLGSISGVLTFSGTPPPSKVLSLPPGCAEQHDGPVADNTLLVREGRLENVLISIKEGLGSWGQPPPIDEVVIDQLGCIYRPRVVGVQVGQPVTFLNSDPVLHNVRTLSKDNPAFNDLMPGRAMRLTKVFLKAERTVHAKCDIHPWMGAHVAVLPHPYFAVSNARGEYRLRHLPEGEYTIEAWHEVLGTMEKRVKVLPRETTEASFAFK